MNARTPYLQVAGSGVHGLGAFVTQDLPMSTLLGTYQGRRYSPEQLRRRSWDDSLTYLFSLSNGETIDGSRGGNATRHINHSCAPNAEAIISGRRVWIWSRRNIKAGEEIVYNYGKEYFDDIIKPIGCKCVKCRAESKAKRKRSRK